MMHHADAAGDGSSVLRFAFPAADDASRRGAHRQAAAFCRTALHCAHSMTPAEHATLLDRFAVEASGGADREEALVANERAFELWLGLGDTLAQGRNRLARFELVFLGQNRAELKASRLAETAVQLLKPHGPSRELALAFADLAYVAALNQHDEESSAAQTRAIAMAEDIGDAATLGRVLLRVSFYSSAVYGPAHLANIDRAMTLAADLGDEQLAAPILTLAAQLLWHTGERDAFPPDLLEPLTASVASRINPWTRGQAAHWLARLGRYRSCPRIWHHPLRCN